MIDHVITALCNVFLLFVIWQFYDDFLDPIKEFKYYRWITGIAWATLTHFLSEAFHSVLVNIIASIILLVIMTIPYHGSIYRKILIAIMIEALNSACDYFSYVIISRISRSDNIYGISFVGTVILAYIAEIIIRQFIKPHKDTEIDRKGMITLMNIPVCMLIIMYCLIQTGVDDKLFTVIIMCLLITCFSAFYMYDVIVADRIYNIKESGLRKQIESYKRELERIESTEVRIEGIRHDLRHHIIEMQDMIDTGDMANLANYLDQISKDLKYENKVSHTGKYEVDSLINYMVEEANNTLNHVDISISIPKDINVDIYHLNVILGNLMENAIEAAKLSKEKYMGMTMEIKRGILFISVHNSFNGEIQYRNGRIISSKSGDLKHGLGLRNVERIVCEMNGEINIAHKDELFCVDVMIYI